MLSKRLECELALNKTAFFSLKRNEYKMSIFFFFCFRYYYYYYFGGGGFLRFYVTFVFVVCFFVFLVVGFFMYLFTDL